MTQFSSQIDLPISLEQSLIGRFLGDLRRLSRDLPENGTNSEHSPFLTIVTRTQGQRLDTLRDLFLCLSGQSCIDFEHVIVGHKLSPGAEQAVLAIVDENPRWLRNRIRFIAVDHGNRTAPLNAAFAQARGNYVAILDDDDLVFAHWVETFKRLAEANPGFVVRSGSIYQRFGQVETRFAEPASRADSEFIHLYPSEFDFFAHLQENRTPLMALAFPRAVFTELGLTFDETLSTGEDWDYLMRVAAICGVVCSAETTALYRHWHGRDASRTAHAAEEWERNLNRIREKHESMDMLLPAGSAGRLRRMMEERDILARAVRLMDSTGSAARHAGVMDEAASVARHVLDREGADELESLRAELSALYGSVWWRLSAPVRWASRFAGRGFDQPEPRALTGAHLKLAISAVRSSTSWRMSAPLRSLQSRFVDGTRP